MRATLSVLAIVAALGCALAPLPAVAGPWLQLGMTGIQESGPNIDVDIGSKADNDGWGGVNPLWIVVGVIALVLLAVLIAMSVRGTGTTVVRN